MHSQWSEAHALLCLKVHIIYNLLTKDGKYLLELLPLLRRARASKQKLQKSP